MVPQEHTIFRNLGGWKFEDVSATAGAFFDTATGVKSVGRGAAFADYDNDGRIDAFVVNLGGPPLLLRNTSPQGAHWLAVRLAGRKSNRDGIGAQIEIDAGKLHLRKERIAGSGYLSQDDPRVHFGLGAAEKVDTLTVTWPSGTRQILKDIPVDRILTVEEK
jgi:hypothetical protein